MPDLAGIVRSYDDIPYDSFPFPSLQPARLAAAAQLFGLAPTPPDRARVLEIGGASGGHLMPLAFASPQARFLGIDISPTQVAEGQARVARLGLGNIELQCRSVEDLGPADGAFDYIICHGVYSWVPAEIQAAILQAVRDRLAPGGVAAISYNVMPGWRMLQGVRDALHLHTRHAPDTREKIRLAREMFALMRERTPEDGSWGAIWRREAQRMAEGPDFYLAHEIFELNNNPCSFTDFIGAASARGFAYLGETNLRSMIPESYPPATAAMIRELSGDDVLEAEQYVDIVSGRTLRQTMLVRAEEAGGIDHALRPSRLAGLHFCTANNFTLVEARRPDAFAFRLGEDPPMEIGDAPVVAALRALAARRPASSSLAEIALPGLDAAGREHLAGAICKLLCLGALHAGALPVTCAPGIGAKPKAWALAAQDAAHGVAQVTTPRHEVFRADPVAHFLLPLVDGTRTHDELAAALVAMLRSGGMRVRDLEGNVIEDPARQAEMAAATVGERLARFARAGLLVE